MSSGEKAKPPAIKPPATYEERNPFDISRRSEKDIAAEIAQRMAAWKQARGRSYATPSTVPGGEAKLPPVSAPVQPARLPQSGGQATPARQPQIVAATVAQPRQAEAAAKPAQRQAESGARVPLFATVSAMRRAMPPAPSLKRPASPVEAPVATAGSGAVEIEAPKTEMVEIAAQSTVPAHVDPVMERAGIATVDAAAEASETSSLPATDSVAETLHGDAHADEQSTVASPSSAAPETRVIEARDESSAAVPEIEPAAPEAEARDGEIERPDLDTPMMEMRAPDPAPEIDAPVAESEPIESTAPAIPSIEALEAATRRIEGRERKEPIFAAPAAPSMEAHDVDPDPVQQHEADAPVAESKPIELTVPAAPWMEAHDDDAEPVQEHEIDAPVAGSGRSELIAPAIPSIEELEAATSRIEGRERREPTFDEPAAEPPVVEDAAPAPQAAEQPDKAARTRTRAAPLPSIETRIEKRRIESLRADPSMAGRRPIFPHIDPEDWPAERLVERDVPPPVAARAQRQPRGGTGWAIGLGTLLLIAGITAPAAIWQGRQQAPAEQDQLVMLPAPSQPETAPTMQATLPAPPQIETSAPEIPPPETVQPPVAAAEAPSVPSAPEASQPAPQEPQDQTTLGAVQSGGELNEAPISMPPAPAPVLDLATKPTVPVPPAARPFVPEPGTLQQAKPFRPAPAGAQTASIALKPNLMGVLKPKTARTQATKPAASAPQKVVVRKPKPFFQQSPDQMFETLINTLSQGNPANPANKPVPPSTRR